MKSSIFCLIFFTLFWNVIFAKPIENRNQARLCAIHVPICDLINPAISEHLQKTKNLKDKILEAKQKNGENGDLTEAQKLFFHQELQNFNIQLESIYEHGKALLRDKINKAKGESVNGELSRDQKETFRQELDVLKNLNLRIKSQGIPKIVRCLAI